jgi:hypothetical protein
MGEGLSDALIDMVHIKMHRMVTYPPMSLRFTHVSLEIAPFDTMDLGAYSPEEIEAVVASMLGANKGLSLGPYLLE